MSLDSAVWRDLRLAAAAEEVEIERLLEHAVLYYLADVVSERPPG